MMITNVYKVDSENTLHHCRRQQPEARNRERPFTGRISKWFFKYRQMDILTSATETKFRLQVGSV